MTEIADLNIVTSDNDDMKLAFKKIQLKKSHLTHTDPILITKHQLDKTLLLRTLIDEQFNENWRELIAEFQLSFLIFLFGSVYDGFEHWKSLLVLVCSCDDAIIDDFLGGGIVEFLSKINHCFLFLIAFLRGI